MIWPVFLQGLSVPDYFSTFTTTNGHGPINTGSQSFNSEKDLHPYLAYYIALRAHSNFDVSCTQSQAYELHSKISGTGCSRLERLTSLLSAADIFNSIFSTGAAVALIITMVLDNTGQPFSSDSYIAHRCLLPEGKALIRT